MKKTKVAYYIVTALFSLFITIGAVVDVMGVKDAKDLMVHLGYPVYVLYIIGWAKLLGVVGIWQPKFPALREWAYAGIVFDLVGAIISHLAVGDGPQGWFAPVVPLLLLTISYLLHRKIHATLAVTSI